MVDQRPFMMNAYRDWIMASGCSPYFQVKADGASVPREHVKNGKIILNTSSVAIKDFLLNEHGMMFSARFGGKDFPIFVPIKNIETVYSRETGDGCHFASAEEVFSDMEGVEVLSEKKEEKKKAPFLSVVK